MSDSPVDGLDEQPVILCVTSSRHKRAQLAQMMSGCGTLLMFPDMKSVRSVLFGEAQVSAPAPVREMVTLGPLVIDRDRQQVSWAGRVLPLTRIEREVLAALASPGLRVWTYQQLYEQVWGAEYLDDVSAVRSTVKRLRFKLREADASIILESMRGVGFFLVEAVDDENSANTAEANQESHL
ncbi:winged helix-turn-helix domain-containing protein [Sphaerisporangium aureirubrum]|uniref:Winged helix-turn-helix domain-containing protein n=1 Tax=Sphaerisporangium aureirubrum TaxID=1544736 RepID=A0ABW1NDV6_9ACTN